jgi:hypothetical protein
MSANEVPADELQVGGSHYKSDYDHWNLVVALEMSYFEGQISRYITRWRKKNGLEDLQKALHYLNKLIEVCSADPDYWRCSWGTTETEKVLAEVSKFNKANELTALEGTLILNIALWKDESDLNGIRDLLEQLMDEAEPKPVPVSDSNKHADRSGFSMDQGDVSDRLSNFDAWGDRIRPRG